MNKHITVTIEIVHPKGVGVASLAGYGRIYVPFAFKGETVEVKLLRQERKGGWSARRISNPKEHCSVAGICGGCMWPGAPYLQQLEIKKQIFLTKARNIPNISKVPIKISGDSRVTQTRARIHLHANFFGGRFNFGFYAQKSRDVVAIEDCPTAEAPLRDTLQKLSLLRRESYSGYENFGFGIELSHLPFSSPCVLLVIYAAPKRTHMLEKFSACITSFVKDISVYIAFKEAPFFIYDKADGFTFYTIPGTFQQVNRVQSHYIRKIIREEILRTQPKILFDIYGGAGNYALPFHRLVEKIYGVDENSLAIRVAQKNIEANGVYNALYLQGDAGDVFEKKHAADFIILDPARWGLSAQVVEALPRFMPHTIIYISNHTESFVRDAKLLSQYFRLEKIELVDFFPFTLLVDIVSIWKSFDRVPQKSI